MADKDAITKDYMQDREIFADAFNFLIYNGKQVIKLEQLKPLDTTSIGFQKRLPETPREILTLFFLTTCFLIY